jgi:hypothetical protein
MHAIGLKGVATVRAGDTDGIRCQQFSADWARVAMKHRFVALIGRSDKDRLAGDSEELQAGALSPTFPLHPPHSTQSIIPHFFFHTVAVPRFLEVSFSLC